MPSPRPAPTMAPRGPLPARVYWFRRLVVLSVAVLLVAGLARVLGASSDASSDEDARATTAGATTSPSQDAGESVSTPAATAPVEAPGRRRKKRQTPTEPPLAEPTGACENGDIVATPAITEAAGGGDVPITLNLRTRVTEACTWTVSPETLTVSITSGSDAIWSSRECPAAIVPQDVVVRQAVDAPVVVTWSSKRSDEDCSSLTEWALPGYYHVEAAALAGEPTEVQFELVRPASEVITRTVTPQPHKGRKKRQQDSAHRPGEDGGGNSAG